MENKNDESLQVWSKKKNRLQFISHQIERTSNACLITLDEYLKSVLPKFLQGFKNMLFTNIFK